MISPVNSRLKFFSRAIALAVFVAGVLLASRGQADDPADAPDVAPTTYIGELKGAPESARISFVIEGDKFVAYVCSADKAFNETFSRWLRGEVTKGKLSAKSPCGAAVTASASADTVTGTLTKEGTSFVFTAKAVAGDANAGLFRAADKLGEDDVIFGWIMDEKGEIVGSATQGAQTKQTLPAPKGTGNIVGKIGNQKVPAGKVTGAANDPKASLPGRKFDVAAQKTFLKNLVEQRRAEGGNPIQAMVVHQVRRFVAGEPAKTKLEEKVFAALGKAPKGTLEKYLKDWDKLPVATREALLGPAARDLDPKVGLTSDKSKKLVQGMPQIARLKIGKGEPKAAAGTVKSVGIRTVKCNSETLPKPFGQDEVFAIHAVFVGTSGPVFKQTKLLREFDDGVTQAFPEADKGVFPLPGLTPSPGAEVTVLTNLFEDDGAILIGVLNVLKPLIETVAFLVLEPIIEAKGVTLDEAGKEALKAGIKGVIDGAIGTLGNLLTQPLGSDIIVVRPNGAVVGSNGAAKTKMSFRRVSGGDLKHDYELSGIEVQK